MKNSTINEFFEKWADETIEWHRTLKAEYKELGGRAFNEKYKFSGMSKKTIDRIANHRMEATEGTSGSIVQEIKKDMEAKKEILLSKIQDKVGEIEEISLYNGEDGTPNGYVKGDKTTVTIQTIIAEGAVQCAHYRVLVKVKK